MVGAASTKSGRFSTAGWAGPGERDEKVYARNRCRYAFKQRQLQSGGCGLVRGAHPPVLRAGNSWSGIARWGWRPW